MKLFRIHGYTDSGEQVTVTVDLEKLRQALASDYDREEPDDSLIPEQEREYRRITS